jgi:hypothetical protein
MLALSIDLDALDLYLGLYGLPLRLSEEGIAAVPARAVERFGDLCASLGVAGTLFVVGRDLSLGRAHPEIKAAAAAGHEIASHSFAHDYSLSRRTPEKIEADLIRAEQEIEAVTGQRPVGFRAPGYTLSATLQGSLAKRGYLYDSSLLPSPPYYAAKAAVMGALALTGKRSRSILGHPAQLLRSRVPHRDAYGVMELPVTVLPGLRVPYIGTLLAASPDVVGTTLAQMLSADELVVIELHGVDLCDGSDGMPPELLARQRDLRIPASVKRRRIEAALRVLLRKREARTLAQCARLVSASASS